MLAQRSSLGLRIVSQSCWRASSVVPSKLSGHTDSQLFIPIPFTSRVVQQNNAQRYISSTASNPPTAAQLINHRASNELVKPVVPSSDQPVSPSDDKLPVLPHPIWSKAEIEAIQPTHRPPQGVIDWLAYLTIKAMRFNFDWMSGWNRAPKPRSNELSTSWSSDASKPLSPAIDQALSRIVFLETVAGIPGSIAGTLRHLASLRRMRRDHGWINLLLTEAENERIHLLTAIELKQPSKPFKAVVFLTQGIFFNWFWICYLISPKYCHRMVGYLEEEATRTYTKILERIDDGTYAEWQTQPAPDIARKYWQMSPQATLRDVILQIRADEAHHRDVNHHFADIPSDALAVYSAKDSSLQR